MKIQLTYDNPAGAKTDLLVIVVDESTRLYNLGDSVLGSRVAGIAKDFASKRLRREYLAALDGPVRHLLVFSAASLPAMNLWEGVKTFAARAVRTARDLGVEQVTFVANTEAAAPYIGKIAEGALLGAYTFDRYKKKDLPERAIRFHIAGSKAFADRASEAVKHYSLVAECVNTARDLVNEPGSVVTPDSLARTCRAIAKASGLDIKIWDERQLEKEGFMGLVSVGRGSEHPPRMIRLSYRSKGARHHLALVGKGVTFDTGGISLKPSDKMYEMKGDMAGAAAVMAAMQAIGKLKPGVNVTGIVCAAENFPDARAQRPGDIFKARNGKYVMVDNTDAEGRLILTDGLFLAGAEKATHIVDIATLTGACVRALGPDIAGVMGNSPALVRAVIAAGRNHGEQFWELPLPPEYKEMLKTPYADLNNIGGPAGGALTAGLFLQEFVPEKTEWVHLDIAGPFLRDKDWKYYEAGATGFGAKTLIDLAERFSAHLAG